ncbi:MAG: NAD(P)H-dependent oxidoreductase [Planctomycetes bacterium]|nr:NAD(P)H-dependent oxidoreductase [Planctomycetota bacterium]MCC7172595.1 NAD(P)H-dependent oxidoreductase [Planctomycetota bacterium]
MTSSSTLTPNAVLERLQWRYAVKKFDAQKTIPNDTWDALEQSLVLAPSSFGLQPWKFFVVDSPAKREQLLAASWKQRQVVDASHYVVFARPATLGPADVDRFIDRTAEVRGMSRATFDGYRNVIVQFIQQPRFDAAGWMARQAYLALGQFMTAAAAMGVDTCPMEGIDPKQYDAILGLEAKGYVTLCACAAGYRAADDKHATAPKVRYPTAAVIEHV